MKTTYGITSPLTASPGVRTAQRKLIRAKFLRPGQDDSVYGPETARAAAQAHWELGFPPALAHAPVYGEVLDNVLTAWLKDGTLPAGYAARRKKRLAMRALGQKALAWLRPHVGDTEQPRGSNRVSWASIWYGLIGPWCAMGLTRALVEAGSTAFKRGVRYASVTYIVQDAINAQNGLTRVLYAVAQGDLVCFDWNGDGTYDHVEIVDEPPAGLSGGAVFTTIGCNTSFDDTGDQSNGGACAAKTRTILGGGRTIFVRVLR